MFEPVHFQGHQEYLSHLQTKLLHSKFLEIKFFLQLSFQSQSHILGLFTNNLKSFSSEIR